MGRILAGSCILFAVVACSAEPTGASSAEWTTGLPACGAVIASWSGIDAYSNGSCFGNVNCINCDAHGFTVHTSSNGATAYGGAWQCVELVTRTFDTKYGIWLSNNAGTPLCNTANATSGLTVYGPGYHDTSPPKPVPGDALVWNDGTSIGHTALVTATSSTSISYMQQNWGSTTGYAATGTTSWSGSNFSSPSDSLGGFTPVCWIHANANTTGSCIYGNGLYCGGDGVSGNTQTLYDCTNGTLTVTETCGVSCVHNPPGVNDACAPCPKGDGTYCGGSGVGTDPSTLYECKGTVVTPLEKCTLGCYHAVSSKTDAWSDACVSANVAPSPTGVTDEQAPSSSPPPSNPTPDPSSTASSGCSTAPSQSEGWSSMLLAWAVLALRRRSVARPPK